MKASELSVLVECWKCGKRQRKTCGRQWQVCEKCGTRLEVMSDALAWEIGSEGKVTTPADRVSTETALAMGYYPR